MDNNNSKKKIITSWKEFSNHLNEYDRFYDECITDRGSMTGTEVDALWRKWRKDNKPQKKISQFGTNSDFTGNRTQGFGNNQFEPDDPF